MVGSGYARLLAAPSEIGGKMSVEKKPNVAELNNLIRMKDSALESLLKTENVKGKEKKKNQNDFIEDLKKMESVSEEMRYV